MQIKLNHCSLIVDSFISKYAYPEFQLIVLIHDTLIENLKIDRREDVFVFLELSVEI